MSYSTDPYPSLGLRTPDSTQHSENSRAPFDYTPGYAHTRPASEALVGLLSSPSGVTESHSFGPELRLSPSFDYTEVIHE